MLGMPLRNVAVPVISANLLEILLGKSCLPFLVAPTDSKFNVKYFMILSETSQPRWIVKQGLSCDVAAKYLRL